MSALNQREHATVLAALRFYQATIVNGDGERIGDGLDNDANALSMAEIDDLCERLNCEDANPAGEPWVIRHDSFRPAGQPQRLRRIVIVEGKRLVAMMDGPFGDTEDFVVRNFEAIVRDHNNKIGGAS